MGRLIKTFDLLHNIYVKGIFLVIENEFCNVYISRVQDGLKQQLFII